jgi:hypothetical protein
MTRMLKGTEIASIIAAVVTSLDNCINPKRTPRHKDDPRPNKKPLFMVAPVWDSFVAAIGWDSPGLPEVV